MSRILAVWNDCATGAELDYEHWYVSEHFPERLSIPGFRRGFRYEAASAAPRYFTYYETDTSEVLASPAYIERLNDPTPWTRRIMQSTFLHVTRTSFDLAANLGPMWGSDVLTMRWKGA